MNSVVDTPANKTLSIVNNTCLQLLFCASTGEWYRDKVKIGSGETHNTVDCAAFTVCSQICSGEKAWHIVTKDKQTFLSFDKIMYEKKETEKGIKYTFYPNNRHHLYVSNLTEIPVTFVSEKAKGYKNHVVRAGEFGLVSEKYTLYTPSSTEAYLLSREDKVIVSEPGRILSLSLEFTERDTSSSTLKIYWK